MRESSVKHTSAHVFNVNREIVMENVINLEPLCGIVGKPFRVVFCSYTGRSLERFSSSRLTPSNDI